jgi:uncharacterized protein (DUF302 family)
MEAERTGPPGMKRLRATGSVDASFARLEAAVTQRGLTVFARVDFAADAAAAGLVLPPTRLLLFGNPRAGTPLIAAAPTVALDLPLRVLVWEAGDGTVWVGYTTPEYLAERHSVPTQLLANVRAVETLAAIAAGTA